MQKKAFKILLLIGALGIVLVGCGSSQTTADSSEAIESTKEEETNEQVPAIGKLASVIPLTYEFGDHTETVDATLWQGQNNYYIYLPETVTVNQDQAGIDIVKTLEIPESSMEIDVLNQGEDLEALVNAEKQNLESSNPGKEIQEDSGEIPFKGKLLYGFKVMGENQGTAIYLVEIEGTIFKIKMNLWASEIWESTRFITMINSIGTFQEDVAK